MPENRVTGAQVQRCGHGLRVSFASGCVNGKVRESFAPGSESASEAVAMHSQSGDTGLQRLEACLALEQLAIEPDNSQNAQIPRCRPTLRR